MCWFTFQELIVFPLFSGETWSHDAFPGNEMCLRCSAHLCELREKSRFLPFFHVGAEFTSCDVLVFDR